MSSKDELYKMLSMGALLGVAGFTGSRILKLLEGDAQYRKFVGSRKTRIHTIPKSLRLHVVDPKTKNDKKPKGALRRATGSAASGVGKLLRENEQYRRLTSSLPESLRLRLMGPKTEEDKKEEEREGSLPTKTAALEKYSGFRLDKYVFLPMAKFYRSAGSAASDALHSVENAALKATGAIATEAAKPVVTAVQNVMGAMQKKTKPSEHIYNPTNPWFIPTVGASLGATLLTYKLLNKFLGVPKTPEERRLRKAKKEFRRALLAKSGESVTDSVDVCNVMIDRIADEMEKQAIWGGGATIGALNMLALLSVASGTLAYIQEKKRRQRDLDETWRRMTAAQDPKVEGLLSAAVNLPSDAVASDSLALPKKGE